MVSLLALLLVAGLVAGEVRLGYGRDWLDRTLDGPDPLTEPTAVPPPEGLTLPGLADPDPIGSPLPTSGRPVPAAVRRALAPLLADPDLGRHVVAAVGGLADDGRVVVRGSGRVVPASTTKLVTGTAALAALGPDHVFTTRAVLAGRFLTLVGGGDPYLASQPPSGSDPSAYPPRADLTSLARLTAAALRERGVRQVAVGYDDALFTGPVASPAWRADYLPDEVVAPITALMVDGGRPESGSGRVDDPSEYAARLFADALRRQGIRLRGELAARNVGGAPVLAAVTGAPLDQVVEHVIEVSDNEGAEVLAHHVGLAVAGEGSFAGGRAGVTETLAGLGVDLAGDDLYDGSGLSRRSRIRIETLVDVLRLAAAPEHPELRAVVTGLPVAGFTGSLTVRFADTPAAAGLVRAKTGTLTGVSGLAGLAVDADGDPLVFAAVADRVARPDTLDARATLDRLAAALTTCPCLR